jgi:hypothetical protein
MAARTRASIGVAQEIRSEAVATVMQSLKWRVPLDLIAGERKIVRQVALPADRLFGRVRA